MSVVSNHITIQGHEYHIDRFIDDEWYDYYGGTRKRRYNNGDVCELQFLTDYCPDKDWLKEMREKYPSLKFTLKWHYKYDNTGCGLIEPDGQEFEITNEEDFKLACQLLKQHKYF